MDVTLPPSGITMRYFNDYFSDYYAYPVFTGFFTQYTLLRLIRFTNPVDYSKIYFQPYWSVTYARHTNISPFIRSCASQRFISRSARFLPNTLITTRHAQYCYLASYSQATIDFIGLIPILPISLQGYCSLVLRCLKCTTDF